MVHGSMVGCSGIVCIRLVGWRRKHPVEDLDQVELVLRPVLREVQELVEVGHRYVLVQVAVPEDAVVRHQPLRLQAAQTSASTLSADIHRSCHVQSDDST